MNNFPFFCLHPKVMQKRYRNIRIQNIFFPAVMLQWGSRHRAAALKLAHRPFTFFTDQNLHLFFRMKDFQLPKSFHPARHLFIHFFLCQIIVLHLFFRIGTCLKHQLLLQQHRTNFNLSYTIFFPRTADDDFCQMLIHTVHQYLFPFIYHNISLFYRYYPWYSLQEFLLC